MDESFNRRLRTLNESFVNPLGAYTTPQVRDAVLQTGTQEIEQERAGAKAASYSDLQQADLARLAMIAEMTQPRLVQTGSTQSGSQTVPSPGIGSSIAQGGATVGSAALL